MEFTTKIRYEIKDIDVVTKYGKVEKKDWEKIAREVHKKEIEYTIKSFKLFINGEEWTTIEKEEKFTTSEIDTIMVLMERDKSEIAKRIHTIYSDEIQTELSIYLLPLQ